MKSSSFQNDGRNLNELLNDDYPEIAKAIKKEGYNLDFLDFDIFEEIHFNDKTVGFITLKRFALVSNQFEITDSYVIPEFRGNNLLFEKLSLLLMFDNLEFYPKKPTRAFINVLLKNDYAFKLKPDFVVSYLKFIADADEIYKNPKIKRFYKNSDFPLPFKANLFDMDLCTVMFRDPSLEVIKYSDFFALAEPRKYDLKKYKLRKKLKRVSEKYIDEKYFIWDSNYSEIESFIQQKDDEFEESLLVENIIGSEDELLDSFADSLKECNLTIEDGFKIREHIVEGLKSGQLTSTSHWQRIHYLMDNIEAVDKKIDDYDESIDQCPFCGESVDDSLRSCLSCGLSIREIDFEEHAVDNLNKMMENLLEGWMNRIDEGALFEDRTVAINENDEFYDLKMFFNKHMEDYDYDEFLEFYKSSDESLSIEEVRDAFLEDKLNESLGSEKDLDTYFTYLSHYFYYNLRFDRFDEAFVGFVQMIILALNKSDSINDLFESNPYSFDIMSSFLTLEDLNHSFDVSKLFNQAVDTFKIDKYNNNHESALSFLEIF